MPETELPKIEQGNNTDLTPSPLTYFVLLLISAILVFIAFKFSNSDWPSVLINLATEIFGAVIILIFIEKRIRKPKFRFLRGTYQRLFEKLFIFFSLPNHQINNYLKSAGLHLQDKQDLFYIERPALQEQILSIKTSFILIGPPGSGKTELLHRIFLKKVRIAYKSPRNAIVPIFIPLRQWHENIYDTLLIGFQLYTSFSENTLKRLLVQNRLLCFFDGLDEVFDSQHIIEEINKFHLKYPDIQIILSSRPTNNFKTLANDISRINAPELTQDEYTKCIDIKKKYYDIDI